MNQFDIYAALRAEIITNHVLMHWFSIVVAITLIVSIWIVENRKTILSIFVPLFSLAWAASMVRFDFFIHRQAAYLRLLESQLQEKGVSGPLWETWKASSKSTPFVVPVADVIAVGVIVIPTLYLLFGPAQDFCRTKGWDWGRKYAWSVCIVFLLLLLSLTVIPRIATF